jgi:hypothetical protein
LLPPGFIHALKLCLHFSYFVKYMVLSNNLW